MQAYRTVIIIISLLLQQACGFITKPHENPIQHRINIHSNPQPGDFAVHANITNTFMRIWKVLAVNPKGTLVKTRVTINGSRLHYENQFLVDSDGIILKAWVQHDDGERLIQKIAQPGEKSSLENYTKLKQLPEKEFRTRAGSFKIDEVYAFTYRLNSESAVFSSGSTDFLSNSVPFRLVENRQLARVETAAFLQAATSGTLVMDAYATGNYNRLLHIDQYLGNVDGLYTTTLLDYGNVKLK